MDFVFDDGGTEPSQHQQPLQPPADEDGTFSIGGSILVPGVKHMLDNIQKDTLSKLSWYPTFSVACLGSFDPIAFVDICRKLVEQLFV